MQNNHASQIVNKELRQSHRDCRGASMMELLLSLALIAVLLPFVVRWEKQRVTRAENLVVAKNLDVVRTALERYMDDHRKELLTSVSKNIVRVRISALSEYGVPDEMIKKHGDNFQLRILKSADVANSSVLQGIVIMTGTDFTPLRTRELVMLSGESAGFIDGTSVYGAYGTYSTSTGAIGAGGYSNSVASSTRSVRSADEYIWRTPSNDSRDATLLSNLNMGGHDIENIRYLDGRNAQFEDSFNAREISAGKIIYANRSELSLNLDISGETTINGILSADSRNMQINGDIILDNSARFNNVVGKELWADTMHLAGLTISSDKSDPAIVKVNQTIDMTGGRISALFVTVGFTGSLTPRLIVKGIIQDAADDTYFWDTAAGVASLDDISFPALNPMMRASTTYEGTGTESYRIMAPVSANANATVADFMRALGQIKNRVTSKYQSLNLE